MSHIQEAYQERSLARQKALQVMFQSEVSGLSFDDISSQGLYLDEMGVPCDFTKLLLAGVEKHCQEIDDLIAQTSENWSLVRMPLVDKSILRLALFEMLFVDEVPYSVSINEAVELAKCFGGEDESSRFVNGVLGKIASHLHEESSNQNSKYNTGGKKAKSKREKKATHG